MSRIGLKPIPVPDGVVVEIHGDHLLVKGEKGELTSPIPEGISFQLEDSTLSAARDGDGRQSRSFHGLARALAANAVQGVTKGFRRELRLHGIGYRAAAQGNTLNLQLGFSHPVEFPIPKGLQISTPDQTKILIEGIDKQLVGETAAQIRRIRPPDAYKGKGIRYSDEIVRTKVGKSGVGA